MPDILTAERFRRDRLDLFWWFVCERQTIWHKRVVEHRPPPWTDNLVMQRERFTNMYRELDPGTQYVIREILERDAPKPDKTFNVMLYRLIGRAETHAAIGFQWLDRFDPAALERDLKRLRDEEGKPPFTAAYMVSAYASMGSRDKIENVVKLFTLLHAGFDDFSARIAAATHPSQVYTILASAHGFGNFLAYQVLVDLLYPLDVYGGRPLLPFSHDDWSAAGPGAQRGIRMLLRDDAEESGGRGGKGGKEDKSGSRPDDLTVMRWLREHQRAEFTRLGLGFPYLRDTSGMERDLSLANIQNCLCEFHKFVKIGEGTGRGRRKFAAEAAQTLAPPAVQLTLAFTGPAEEAE